MDFSVLKNQRWIIGVSGGPDSMALLDMCVQHHIEVVCAHVNYHHRPTADRDQLLTQKFCDQHNLVCQIYSVTEQGKGNFQQWAREVRYQFFQQLCQEVQATGVLVAHQLDDHLETALMQMQSGRSVNYWGIQESSQVCHVQVVRPLLMWQKQELLDYCLGNKLPFGIDESNLTQDYRRNQLRHQIIEKMSIQQKEALKRRFTLLNQAHTRKIQQAIQLCDWQRESLEVSQLQPLSIHDQSFIVRQWFLAHGVSLSSRFLSQILQLVKRNQNCQIPCQDQLQLSLNYGKLELVKTEEVSYCYVLDKIEWMTTPWFTLALQGESTEAVTLAAEDYPITIRNAKASDEIQLRFGKKKLNRWFIDRKIPHSMRKSWPVVLNCHQEVILVPKIGCNVTHYSNNPNCFVIK